MSAIKKTSALLSLLLLILALFCLSGCVHRDAILENNIKNALNAVIADDEAAFLPCFSEEALAVLPKDAFAELKGILSGAGSYALTQMEGKTVEEENAVWRIFSYRMDTDGHTYHVTGVRRDNASLLYSLTVSLQDAITYTGTLGHMENASALQWLLLFSTLPGLGFAVWMAVDAVRRPLKNKVLWILIILLGAVAFSFVSHQGIQMDTTWGLLLTPNHRIVYSNGLSSLNFILPLGALVYLVIRKKLPLSPVEAGEEPDEETTGEAGAEETSQTAEPSPAAEPAKPTDSVGQAEEEAPSAHNGHVDGVEDAELSKR